MLTIDTHYHASLSWFEPVEVLLFHMSRAGVDRAVLCQHRTQYDNRYLIECARRYPGRFSIVGTVDIDQPDAGETLAKWASEGMGGLRLWATERSPGSDPLALWQEASKLGLVISCPGTTEEYASDHFRKMVEALPDTPIILEHMGILGDLSLAGEKRVPQPPFTTYRKVLALSRYPNVYMKLTGLGEVMPRPAPAKDPPFDLAEVPPFIDMAIEAFGANRLMIGSDPTSSVREGYGNVWRFLREYLSRWSAPVQEAILGKTAASLFRFA